MSTASSISRGTTSLRPDNFELPWTKMLHGITEDITQERRPTVKDHRAMVRIIIDETDWDKSLKIWLPYSCLVDCQSVSQKLWNVLREGTNIGCGHGSLLTQLASWSLWLCEMTIQLSTRKIWGKSQRKAARNERLVQHWGTRWCRESTSHRVNERSGYYLQRKSISAWPASDCLWYGDLMLTVLASNWYWYLSLIVHPVQINRIYTWPSNFHTCWF